MIHILLITFFLVFTFVMLHYAWQVIKSAWKNGDTFGWQGWFFAYVFVIVSAGCAGGFVAVARYCWNNCIVGG